MPRGFSPAHYWAISRPKDVFFAGHMVDGQDEIEVLNEVTAASVSTFLSSVVELRKVYIYAFSRWSKLDLSLL